MIIDGIPKINENNMKKIIISYTSMLFTITVVVNEVTINFFVVIIIQVKHHFLFFVWLEWL